jgi:hypothetical protein
MSLTTLNNTIKISSAVLTGVNSKDSLVFMSRLNRDDFNIIGNYINNVVVQALKSLTSKPEYPVDALESGISGMTIVTYPENLGNSFSNSEMFWKKGVAGDTGRPCTVKESFDYVLSNLTQQIIQVVERTEDITGLIDELRCNALNNLSIKNETLGVNYPLLCNGEVIGSYPLAKHLYEIFNQVVVGHDIAELEYLDNGDSTYPTLNITAPEAVVVDASETTKGIIEIATLNEVVSGVSGNFAVTAEKLMNALDETGALKAKIKDISFEKLQESSIFDLSDTEKDGLVLNSQGLFYDSNAGKFKNRKVRWSDIENKPNFVENLDDLGDVVINSPQTNHIIYYDGQKWTNRVSSEESIDNEAVEDLVGGLFNNNQHSGISFTYDDDNSRIIATVESTANTLNIKADEEEIANLQIPQDTLSFTSTNNVKVVREVLLDGQDFKFNLADNIVANTFTGNLVGNADTATNATYAETSNYSNYLNNPDVVQLTGIVKGTANYPIGGTANPTNTVTINTTIDNGSIDPAKLTNRFVYLNAGGGATSAQVGGSGFTFKSTTNETEISLVNNEVVFGLPSDISVNAATATKLKTPRTIRLSGGATGSATFDGSGDINITTTVTATNTVIPVATSGVRGGVLLAPGSGNANAIVQRRNYQVFTGFVDMTYWGKSLGRVGITSEGFTGNDTGGRHLIIFRNPSSTTLLIEELMLNFIYSGSAGSSRDFKIGIGADPTSAGSNSSYAINIPGSGGSKNLLYSVSLNVPSKYYFGFYCTAGSTTDIAKGLSIQITGTTEVGAWVY